jgi:branched-chain amino acid transport system permease protein
MGGLVNVFSELTGGELGISGLDRLTKKPIYDYYLILTITIISLLIMWKFTDTRSKFVRTGVILHAIREDEITARASGISTTRYKIMAFAISGFFAGIAGGLYAHFIRIVGPSVLELLFSFNALLWTVFGGITTLYGAVTGVFILYPITEIFRLHKLGEEIRFMIQAIIMIFVLLFMPQGLTRWIRDHIEAECPRCKLINFTTRKLCRGCRAHLHLEKKRESS